MHWYVKNKNRKVYTLVLILATLVGGALVRWGDIIRPSFAQSITQIPVALSLFGADNKVVTNGEYQIRFALYRTDRTSADPYPSNADAGNRVWEEVQTIKVEGGVLRAYLGAVNSLANLVNFENGDYYLGIRIGTDSEMVPRKKLGAVPAAINAQYLRGKTVGTSAGDLVALDARGRINIKQLPTGEGDNQLVLGSDSRFDNIDDIHQQNTDTGTDSTIFTIGTGNALTSGNFDLSVSSAGTPPALRYNGTTQSWQFSDDGTTFTNLSDSGSVNFLETADGTGSTSSYSGFELAGTGDDKLTLLQGCSNGQALAWNDSTNVWECASFSAGLGGSGTAGYATYWSGGSALGSEQFLNTVRGGTGLDASAASNGSLLIGNGSGFTLNTLGTGNGISVTNGVGLITVGLDVTTTGTTATTSSNSGLETDASGLRLLGGCSNDQVLAWSSGSSAWVCSNKSGGTSDWTSTGALTYLTDTTDDLIIGGTTNDEGFTFDVSAGTLSFEGTTANGFETTLAVADPTADRTITLPNVTGTVITSGNLTDITTVGTITSGTWNGGVIGTLYGGTGATSLTNLIALTTHTTGNYVATITAGDGISGTVASEGSTPTLAIDLLDSADGTSLVTSSNSGLEFQGTGSDELTLLQGCSDNNVLSWDEAASTWNCDSVSGVGGIDGTGSANAVAYWTDSNTLSNEAQLAVSRGGTGIGSYTTGDILYASNANTLAARAAVATGNVLISQGVGVAPVWGDVDLTNSVTGILPIANGGTGASTLSDLIALGGNTTGNYVASITNGSGITGGNGGSEGAALTLALGALTADWNQTGAFDISLNNAGAELQILESAGATFFGILDAGDLSANRTLTIPDVSGVIATTNGGQTFTSATWNASAIGVAYGGTGVTTLTPNGVLYGNGTGAVQATSAGTNGQLLVGVSSSAPAFVTLGGDATIANDGTLTISSNAVALGTDTTGNYVSSATTNGGLSLTGTEGASLGILLPAATNGLSATTQSGSGLELTSSGLSLIQGCADNEVLSWDETNDVWKCNSVGGVGAGDITDVVAGNGLTGGASSGSATLDIGAGSGITVNANDIALGALTANWNQTGAFDISLNNAGSELQILESAGGTFFGLLDVGDLSADATYTFSGSSGTVLTSANYTSTLDAIYVNVGESPAAGDITGSFSGGLTIGANTVALTTDTTGNYVASLANGNGITGGAAGSEGATLTLGIDVLDSVDGASAVTSAFSGLEFQGAGTNELTLLQGCSDNQVLAWDEANSWWECSDKTGGTSNFTDSGTVTYLTSTTDDFALGGAGVDVSAFFFDVSAGSIQFEGATADAFETTFSITDATADRTITFADASGTVILSGHTFTGDVTATLDTDGSTALTIAADSVALGTDTTGNYVSSATASGGLVLTGTEGASLGILLQPSGDALSSTTSSGSGLELLSTGLTLLQGCATGEVLKWNETTDVWECGTAGATYSAGSGLTLTSTTFSLGGTLTADATFTGAFDLVLNNASSEIRILESVGATYYGTFDVGNLSADRTYIFPDTDGTIVTTGDTGTVTGTMVLNDTIKEVDLDLDTHAGAGEDGYLLTYNNATGGFAWTSPGTAGVNYFTDSGTVTYLTSTTDDFALGGSAVDASAFFFDVSAGTIQFEGATADAFETTFSITDATADRTITLPDLTGTIALLNAGQTFTSATWNGTAIGAQYGGTGINTSASTGVPTISSGTWSVASQLGVSLGGTNATSIGSAGSIAYSNGSAYAFSAVGTSGQALVSGGTGAPTFFAPTAGSVLFAGTSGILQQDNASFFFNDTTNRLGLGTTSPASMLDIYGTSNALRLSYDGTNYGLLSADSSGNLNITSSPGDVIFGGSGADVIIGDVGSAANLVFEESSTISGQGTNTITMGVSGDTFTFGVSGVTYNYGTITSATWNATNISSTYGGTGINSSASTGVATVSSGVWSIDASLGTTKGGTGITSYTTGDLLYASATNTLSKLAVGSAGNVLVVSGGVPTWSTLGASSITADSLDFTEFQDTLDLDANLTLNQTTNTWSQTFTGDTTTGLTYTANSLTSGSAVAVASSATGLTGNLTSITLSGSNASNTGSLLAIDNTGTSNANTSLYIKHYATGTNNLALRVDDVSGDTTPFVIDGAGNVGIGTSAPTSLFEIYGAGTADAVATITAPDATYDPLLKLRTGSTPAVQFTLGVDNSDGDKFKIYSGDGLGSGDEFVIDSDGNTTIASLILGAQSFETDAGAVTWVDMPVTSSAADNTVERYTAQLDGNAMLTIYGLSDGAGSVDTLGIGIMDTTPDAVLDVDFSRTSGTAFGIALPSATTLAGALTGQSIDLSTNVTATGFSVTGSTITLPTVTNTGSGTYNYQGLTVTGGAITQTTAGGTDNFNGIAVTNSNLTQTTGTLTANGLSVTTGSITTGGTQRGLQVTASGVGAGTLNGVNISNITGGAGTENAIVVGTGWDAGLVVAGVTVVNGSGGIVGSAITADSLDFTEFQDTLDLDANLTLNQTTNTWSQTFTGDTTTGLTYTANSLTTGKALSIESSATGLSTGALQQIILTGSNASNTGNLLLIADTGASNATTPLKVTAAGGSSQTTVLFENTGTGSSFRVNDSASDSTPFLIDASGNVGIGTTTPAVMLDIYGTSNALRLSYDGSNYATLSTASDGTLSLSSTNATESQFIIGTGASVDSSVGFDGSSNDYFAGVDQTSGNFLIGSGFVVQTGSAYLNITSTGLVGINMTPTARFDITHSSTSTTGATEYSLRNTFSDTGIVTTGTDTTYGDYLSVTRTGATGGTINSYGSYITATADNAGSGTATLYGDYVTATGADTTYGYNAAITGSTANTSYGGYFSVTDSTTSANSDYATYANITRTGAAGAATTVYGDYSAVSRTGATTATTTSYGEYTTLTHTGASSGTVNAYGSYITATGDTGGTSTLYGLNVAATGADTTYGILSAVTAVTSATSYGLSSTVTDATTGANATYAASFTNTDTGVVTTGTDTTYGTLTTVSRTGGTGGTFNTYGNYTSLTNTMASGSGTPRGYGNYITATGSSVGASDLYGMYVTTTGADNNYGVYSTLTASTNSFNVGVTGQVTDSTTNSNSNYAANFYVTDSGVNTTGSDINVGIETIVSRTGATGGTITSYGLNVVVNTDNAGSGTATAYGINLDTGVSGSTNADTVYGIKVATEANTSTTAYGLYVDSGTAAGTEYAAAFLNGAVGIGTSTPTSTFELYGAGTADIVSTITAPDATYDPLVKFRTGSTPAVQFTLGVDNSDGDKFKIYSGDGFSGGDEFVIDSNGVTTIANLNLGSTNFDSDAGIVSWVDMPVTASSPAATVESYTAAIDGNAMLTVYAESDGAGSIQNKAINFFDGSVNAKYLSTNFGSIIEAGGFMGNNSYFSEEFNTDTTAGVTADDATVVGDSGNWYFDTTDTAASYNQADQINGYGQVAVTTTATDIAGGIFFGTAQNNASLIFAKANLPVVQMKLRNTDGGTSGNDVVWGLMDTATVTATDDTLPANGIFFWSNNTTTWTGVVRSGGANVGTATCGTQSTTQFAVGKIEVISATSVKFYMDTDVSNGISWTLCGTVSGANPTAAMTVGAYVVHTGTTATNVDVEYVRIWQDDSAPGGTVTYPKTLQSSLAPAPLSPLDLLADTVEEQSTTIDTLSLQTSVNAGTLAELQTSVDEQLSIIGTNLTALAAKDTEFETRFASDLARFDTLDTTVATLTSDIAAQNGVLATMQTELVTMRDQVTTLTDFFTTFNLEGVITKDLEGNVDLLGGKIKARLVEAGGLVIENTDEEAPTIGQAKIYPRAVDADNDGKDDVTGDDMTLPEVQARDGRTVTVMTRAMVPMIKGSRIFTSFLDNPNAFSWIEKIVTEEGEYVGFKIHLSQEITSVTKVDWWLIEQR